MKDYSIEYAHIYTNSEIDTEQKKSLDILEKIKNEESNKELSFVVMIDDYSFPDPTFNYDSFLSWLGDKGHSPDLVIRESQLIPVCDIVLSLIGDMKLKNQITSYIQSKKYPCSLFIATWYLLRLGKIEHNIFPDDLVAKRLINILPKSFAPFEEKGLEIIISTGLVSEELIENRYLDGRLIV
jgi:hypothetical protein